MQRTALQLLTAIANIRRYNAKNVRIYLRAYAGCGRTQCIFPYSSKEYQLLCLANIFCCIFFLLLLFIYFATFSILLQAFFVQ